MQFVLTYLWLDFYHARLRNVSDNVVKVMRFLGRHFWLDYIWNTGYWIDDVYLPIICVLYKL